MKKTAALLAVLAAVGSMAQAPGPQPAAPAPAPGAGRGGGPSGAPAIRSPEVGADRTVTFRLRAPNATAVTVRGISPQPLVMQKDAAGVWSASTERLKPDLYAYSYDVDGLSILDPLNSNMRSSYYRVGQNSVLVPGDIAWTPVPNTPRGAVSRHVFHSKIANHERDFFVYTPPNYDPKRRQPYPILILQHGLGDGASGWIQSGGANVTLDNLINQGKAVPMIMVNPQGYGTAAGPADINRDDQLPQYMRILIDEVMPQVERQYNASTDRTGRAIAGLSLGGAQAILGLNNLEKFAWFGSFSGAFNLWPLSRPDNFVPAPIINPNPVPNPAPAPGTAAAGPGPGRGARGAGPGWRLEESRIPAQFPRLDASANNQIKLIWLICGTADAGALPTNRQFKAYLDSRGVRNTYIEVPDLGHVWPLWRQSLADFAPLLFR